MSERTPPSLDSDEILRVMDAAQVLRARKKRFDEHEALNRDAVVRDIQVIYEDVGDLVERRVIEGALDEYLAQRHSFVPPRPGVATSLARLYIRRGRISRRVLIPAVAIGAIVWDFAGVQWVERREAESRASMLSYEIRSLADALEARTQALEAYGATPAPAQEIYDRVAADKQDNGIIDEDAFGVKRRGYLTVERAFPDLGQITRW